MTDNIHRKLKMKFDLRPVNLSYSQPIGKQPMIIWQHVTAFVKTITQTTLFPPNHWKWHRIHYLICEHFKGSKLEAGIISEANIKDPWLKMW